MKNNFLVLFSFLGDQVAFVLVIFLLLTPWVTKSQMIEPTIVAAAGNLETNPENGHSLFWTLGDLAVETWSNQIKLTEGFHHIFFIITSDEEETLTDLNIFPNPTTGWLNINIESNEKLDIVIFNLLGAKVLEKKNIRQSEKLNLNSFRSGTYLLSIIRDGKKLETFKIIKT